MILIPSTRLPLRARQFSPTFEFDIADNACSIRIATEADWLEGVPFRWDFDVQADGGEWIDYGNFGYTRAAQHPYSRYGLWPGRRRRGRIRFSSDADITAHVQVENSVDTTTLSAGSVVGFGSTDTVAIDWGATANRLLICVYGIHNNQTPFTIQYNGVDASGSIVTHTPGSRQQWARYWLAAATTPGSHQLEFLNNASGSGEYVFSGVPLEGVDQTTPTDSGAATTGTGSPMACPTIASVAGDLVMGSVFASATGGGFSITIGDTVEVNAPISASYASAVSSKPGTGSTILGYTGTSIGDWSAISWNVNADAGGPPPASGGGSNKITRGVRRGITRGMNP